MSNDLLPIKDPKPAELFKPNGLDAILEAIEEQARSIAPDISTAKGRKEIASVAARVARSKTYLDGLGKDFVAGLKEQAKAVDIVRKNARDRLDSLKKEVRRPLTEWENAEARRKAKHENDIAQMSACLRMSADDEPANIIDALRKLSDAPSNPDHWEEYADQAIAAQNEAIAHLERILEVRKQRDAEAAELRRLREEAEKRKAQEAAEQAKRKQAEWERRIAEEAAKRAQQEAAAKVEKERIEQERQRKLELQRAEQARKAAEDEAVSKIAEAQRRAEEAELAAQRVAEEAKLEAEEAKRKAEEEAELQRAKEARRAANKAHQGRIHREARDTLIALAHLSEEQATACIKAIAADRVQHIKIIY